MKVVQSWKLLFSQPLKVQKKWWSADNAYFGGIPQFPVPPIPPGNRGKVSGSVSVKPSKASMYC